MEASLQPLAELEKCMTEALLCAEEYDTLLNKYMTMDINDEDAQKAAHNDGWWKKRRSCARWATTRRRRTWEKHRRPTSRRWM
eukprot:4129676-Pyramimonas_sp.AAC.1